MVYNALLLHSLINAILHIITSKQMKVSILQDLKSLFFKVEKVESNSPGLTFAKNLTHQIVVTVGKIKKVVNCCSKNYGLISMEDLVTPLAKRLEETHHVEVKFQQSNDSRFFIDFIIKDTKYKVQKKDDIFARVRMNNSYDGKVKYQFSFGFYRLVCENGMSVPMGNLSKAIKLRHSAGFTESAIEKTVTAIEAFITNIPEIMKSYEPLVNSTLNWEQAMTKIQATMEQVPKFPKKKEELITARLQTEMKMGLPLNDFLLYNSMNYVLYNNESQMQQHKRDKIDQSVLNFISSTSKK